VAQVKAQPLEEQLSRLREKKAQCEDLVSSGFLRDTSWAEHRARVLGEETAVLERRKAQQEDPELPTISY
jgi:hypothetical protein